MKQTIQDIISKLHSNSRLSFDDALILWKEAPLWTLSQEALRVKRQISHNDVYYNRNFHIEPTNRCICECSFCSFRRDSSDPLSWDYSLDDISRIALEHRGGQETEVHIVGGVHPNHDVYYYIEMLHRIKEALPSIHIKAFTAIELRYMIEKAGLSLEQGLSLLKQAGLESIPGGGAEIFAPRVRTRLCPRKGSAEEWLEVHRVAHSLGIDSNATILYGHIETLEERIDHMLRIRSLQDETSMINAFIPLKFRRSNNALSHVEESSVIDDMRTMAMSRLILDNIPHMKSYWVMYGKQTMEMALMFGADDIDGTIEDSTKIYSMAGAEEQRPRLTIEQIQDICSSLQMRAVERDTHYNIL
ncbi:MAG: CofH family radical SAM protein [Alistipes sp.]|nr:CofH family radical SAM protein [Candidatus Alistipes equi]